MKSLLFGQENFDLELCELNKLRELIISGICLIRVISGSGSFWYWLDQVR